MVITGACRNCRARSTAAASPAARPAASTAPPRLGEAGSDGAVCARNAQGLGRRSASFIVPSHLLFHHPVLPQLLFHHPVPSHLLSPTLFHTFTVPPPCPITLFVPPSYSIIFTIPPPCSNTFTVPPPCSITFTVTLPRSFAFTTLFHHITLCASGPFTVPSHVRSTCDRHRNSVNPVPFYSILVLVCRTIQSLGDLLVSSLPLLGAVRWLHNTPP